MNTGVHPVARELFAPISNTYETWAHRLSLCQDARWRREMVNGLELEPGARVLDVAAGTGSITRLLQIYGALVISLDQSPEMLGAATERGAVAVLATAETLPFPDHTFDAVTFGYLLRYVHDLKGCMSELVRVTRRGGRLGMVEFGRPDGVAGIAWRLYTRTVLPIGGAIAGDGWPEVCRFLGPSIESFAGHRPPAQLIEEWEAAGIRDVGLRKMSLGAGIVMWGTVS